MSSPVIANIIGQDKPVKRKLSLKEIKQEDLRGEYRNIFRTTNICDVIGEKRDILIIDHDEPLESALRKLLARDVRSAPVKTDSVKDTKFIDFIDVVSFLCDLLRAGGNDPLDNLKRKDLVDRFFSEPSGNVANYSQRNIFAFGDLSWNLYQASAELSKGAKRVAITNKEGDIVNLVTHSDVINFLHNYISTHDAKSLKDTLEVLELGTPHVVSVNEDDPTYHAFMLMNDKKLSALPILSLDEGEVLSVVSARDIKLLITLQERSFDLLALPIVDFIKISRQQISSAKTTYPYIWCRKDSSFELIIKRLEATHVHRLIVVNDGKKPTGVVSVTDVIAYLISSENGSSNSSNSSQHCLIQVEQEAEQPESNDTDDTGGGDVAI